MRRRTGWTLCMLGLVSALSAQPGPAAPPQPPPAPPPADGAPPPPQQGRQRSPEPDAGTFFRLVRQMDSNGDLLVEEKELNDGFRQLTDDAVAMHRDLLAWLDKDKNGVLSQEELKPFYRITSVAPMVRSADQNGDMALQEAELDAAFGRMAEFCQTANDRTLEQFDRNHDGKLGEDEIQAARQALQRFSMRSPRGGGEGPGAGAPPPAGAGAPPPAGAAVPPPVEGGAR